MRPNRRASIFAAFASIVVLLATIGAGSAAELTAAEIGALPNDVTVEQGRSATFEVWVAATGRLNCSYTPANPATARVVTRVAVAANGTVSTSAPSAALPFYAGAHLTTDCLTDWDTAPGSYRVGSQVSAAATTPVGDYQVTLSQAAGTVLITNTTGVTPALADAFPATIRIHVIAPVDTAAPVLHLPADMQVEAPGPAGAIVTYSANAVDAFEGPVPITCAPVSGSNFPLGTTPVACSASDSSGNTANGSFDISIVDTTGPTLSLPDDILVDSPGGSDVVVTYAASSLDAVDGPVPVTCSPESGAKFPVGKTVVQCSATDAHKNTAKGSFRVTVGAPEPQEPVLTVPDDITAEATGPGGTNVSFDVSAEDPQDGDVEVTCDPAPGSVFPLDATTTVTCSATDSDGNTVEGGFDVNVVDTTPPALSLPQDIVTGPTGPFGAWVFARSRAADLVDGSVRVRCDRLAWSWFPFGVTTVHCSATDSHGNTAVGSYDVTVTGFRFRGFYRPVENAPVVNKVKAGSTVPIGWDLYGERGVPILSRAAVVDGYPRATPIECGASSGSASGAAASSHGFGGWRWYDYYWRVPAGAGICYRFEVKFTDGSTQVAYFETR